MKIKKTTIILMIIAITTIFMTMAQANEGFNVPLGAENITTIRTETTNLSQYDPESVQALAGNLTELSLTGVSATKSWQGFFGNISGTIILEDGSGARFYDWSAAEPQGQVYASINNSISWTTVECAPINDNTYRTTWHQFYGMNESDYDNINMTYNATDHPEIYVGFETINGCRTTYTFVNSTRQTEDFPALLLTSDTNSTLIFTSIIENKDVNTREGKEGYDNGDYDFQLLVAERGKWGDTSSTTYYFWLELS